MNTEKLGRIQITANFFTAPDLRTKEILKSIFSIFFPIHIYKEPFKSYIVYIGICDRFDAIEEAELIPLYTPRITTRLIGGELDLGQTYSIKMEKQEYATESEYIFTR